MAFSSARKSRQSRLSESRITTTASIPDVFPYPLKSLGRLSSNILLAGSAAADNPFWSRPMPLYACNLQEWGAPCAPRSPGNNAWSSFSPELSSIRISMCMVTGRPGSRCTKVRRGAALRSPCFERSRCPKPVARWSSHRFLSPISRPPWGREHRQSMVGGS